MYHKIFGKKTTGHIGSQHYFENVVKEVFTNSEILDRRDIYDYFTKNSPFSKTDKLQFTFSMHAYTGVWGDTIKGVFFSTIL